MRTSVKCRGGPISVAHVGMKTNMRKIKSDTQTAASEAGEAAQTDWQQTGEVATKAKFIPKYILSLLKQRIL